MSRPKDAFTPGGERIRHIGVVVQGIRILPGDEVLVMVGDRAHKHVYAGRTTDYGDPITDFYWMLAPLTTAEGKGPGPYRLEDLRHPDILTAFAEELD